MKLSTLSDFFSKSLKVFILAILIVSVSGCRKNPVENPESSGVDFNALKFQPAFSLDYASQFSVEKCEGYDLVKIAGEKPVLVLEENQPVPENLPFDYTILRKPLDKVYLLSTSVMDFLVKLNCIDKIKYCGSKKENWYLNEAKEAMDEGKISYAGKYSAPDYEMLLEGGANLAIENTMIYHKPDVLDKFSVLGIPFLIEKSSYEKNPLGRLEWIKLYGLLFDREKEAESFFENEIKKFSAFSSLENSGKKIAFFYVTSSGIVSTRKTQDYIPEMIRIAGGNYFLEDEGKNEDKTSSVNLQFESFYSYANDADILIYNSTIDELISDKEKLLEKNPLFGDFKAFKENRIYCTKKDFFQKTTGIVDFISDLNKILNDDESNLVFLEKIK